MATPTTPIVVQTQRLTHRYGKFAAIKDVDLTVHQGEVFGFLGPNGAGKTTMIRTLLDFIRPSEGSAAIFGLDSVRESVAIRQRIGYLPSELVLWENWTGLEYIRWLERAHRATNGFVAEAERLAAHLDFDLKRSLRGLSTGMKRKIGLIAALAHKPELLILDEPTTGLDPLMQQVFHGLIREIRAEGRTVFMSSHNLPEVEAICDRVGIIREGELEAVESVDTLTRVAFRWLTLAIEGPFEAERFAAIPGVTDLSADGSTLRMRLSGDAELDGVIKLAAQVHVRDLHIEQPTLEEIFLTYYGKQEG